MGMPRYACDQCDFTSDDYWQWSEHTHVKKEDQDFIRSWDCGCMVKGSQGEVKETKRCKKHQLKG